MVINPMADSEKLTNNPVMVINPMDDSKKLTKQPSDGNESHGWKWETSWTTQ